MTERVTNMLKRSINIEVIYKELPWAERFAAVKKDGFDFVEFWGWEDKDLPEVRSLLDKNGVKLSVMSGDGPYSMCDPKTKKQYVDYIVRAVRAAEIVGCTSLVVHSDALEDEPKQHAKPLSGKYSHTTKLCAMFDVLKTIAPIGEEAGITFTLEALNTVKDHCGNFLNDTPTSADLAAAVGSENIKILYDAYHMYLDEGKICETIEKYINVIGYVHIADAPGRHEPGTGAINYRQVLKTLANIRYEQVVGFELYPLNGSELAIKAIKECSDGI